VFENRVLWRIFGPKKAKIIIIGGWRQLHNDQLQSLYSWSNIIRMSKSRRIRRIEHVACIEENYKTLKMNLNERVTAEV
jgi:hypothetical protein